MQKDPYQTLLNYSFWLLGRKAYAEAELRKRLERRSKKLKLPDSEKIIKKVIERLQELQYVDDAKILENYFEYRLKNRPCGKFLFLHEMHRKGISLDTAKAAWEKSGVDEEALAHDLLERKKKKLDALPEVLRKKKIMQLLASRGFSPEIIYEFGAR